MKEAENIVEIVLGLIRYANESGFNGKPPKDRFEELIDAITGDVMDTYTTAAASIFAVINLIPQDNLKELPIISHNKDV
jgi:hypothetical protein